jgi:hypothetical protein
VERPIGEIVARRRWIMSRPSWKALPVLLAASCVSSGSTEDDVGRVRVALAVTPADVLCIRIVAEGSRRVTRLFDVAPGQTPALSMQGLPLGAVTFSGDAFDVACGRIGDVEPAWLADPVTATLVRGVVASVTITMRRNGRATVGVDFEEEPDGAAPADDAPVIPPADAPPDVSQQTDVPVTPPDAAADVPEQEDAATEGDAPFAADTATAEAGCKPNGATCAYPPTGPGECCGGGCIPSGTGGGFCVCRVLDQLCGGPSVDFCCPGTFCRTRLGGTSNKCYATQCALIGEACHMAGAPGQFDTCCSGSRCIASNTGPALTRCCGNTGPGLGASCTTDSDCCPEGQCDPQSSRCCLSLGQYCGGPNGPNCCPGSHCDLGPGRASYCLTGCAQSDEGCFRDADCCSGNRCANGTCTPG